MKKNVFTIAIMALLSSLAVTNASAAWIDWSTTSTGTLMADGTTVNVSMTGNPAALIDGDYYYNNANTGFTSPTGTYAGLAPSDVIQVTGTGSFNLTFDQAVVNPYIALVSVGQPSYGVTYRFEEPFSVVSYGSNYWGYNGYTVSGNDFTGTEFNGVLQFTGSFTSLSFDVLQSENWHGFNIGVADSAAGVPEPAALFLLSAGLIGLGLARKKS